MHGRSDSYAISAISDPVSSPFATNNHTFAASGADEVFSKGALHGMGRRAPPRAAGLRFAAACLALTCVARVAGQNDEIGGELVDGEGSGVENGPPDLDLNSSAAVSQHCLAADVACRCVGRRIEVDGLTSNVICYCGPDCHTCPFDGNRPVGNQCGLVRAYPPTTGITALSHLGLPAFSAKFGQLRPTSASQYQPVFSSQGLRLEVLWVP